MKNKKLLVVQIILILIIAFVWGNSLLSGQKSGEISGGITELISRFLGIASEKLGHLVRKTAHFSEFAALGATLSLLLIWKGQRGAMYFMPLAIGMMAFPLIDETIQVFTPERGPSIGDIWIDMVGYFLGAVAIYLIHKLIVFCKRRRKEKEKNKKTAK